MVEVGILNRISKLHVGSRALSVFCMRVQLDGLSAGAWEQSSGKSTVLQGSAWRWEAAGLARAMVQSQLCDF